MSVLVGADVSSHDEADVARWRRCGLDPAMLAPELIVQLRRFRPVAPTRAVLRPKPALPASSQQSEGRRFIDRLPDGNGRRQRLRCVRDCIAALRQLTQMSSLGSRTMEFEQLRDAVSAFIATI